MIARMPPVSILRWGRSYLALALCSWPLYASCTASEDTEPFVPAVQGASQPKGGGALLSEQAACERVRDAALAAYDRLGCDAPDYPKCPGFLRPGGGSGCYEYREGSIAACEKTYEAAEGCRGLSPCLPTAELNAELSTCDQVDTGEGGAGGADTVSGAGAAPIEQGGSPGVGGAPAEAGAPGVPAGGQPDGGTNG